MSPGPRAAKEGYDQIRSDDDLKIIQRVTERVNWTARGPARWALERQIFESIAFYCGIQWIDYSEQTRRFTRWSAPSWFPTPVTNAIAPRVSTMVSQLLRSRPTGRVRPDTNEPADREAANIADKFIGHFDDVTDEDMLRQEAAHIAALMGTVVFKDYYNVQAGAVLQIPQMQSVAQPVMHDDTLADGMTPNPLAGQPRYWPTGEPIQTYSQQPVLHPDTMPDGVTPNPQAGQPVVNEVREGEIQTQVRMLFNFYHDQKATKLEDAQWCGEAVYADLNWIDQNYPELGPYVAQESGIDSANFFESSLLALVGPSIQGTAHYGGSQYYTHGSVLRWYEERPSQEFPRGLLAIVANGILLFRGDLPIKDENGNPTGDFSFTMFRYDIVPGRFPGRTPCEDMVPLQRRVNGIDAQIVLNRKTLVNPWLLAPKGSGLNPSQVGMRPGAVVLYNYIGVGAAPQVVPGTPLPAQVYDERRSCFEAMDQLAQDARVSFGNLPPGVKSGIALNFLKEQTEESGVPRLQRWAACMAERSRKRLLLAQQNYQEARAIKTAGQGSDWQINYWKGADLRGNTDVSVDPGTLMPRSRSAEIQTMMDAMESGLLNPTDPVQRQKMLEKIGLSDFDTEVGPDRRRQRKEMALMDQGQMVPINDTDNDEIHLVELIPQIKDPSFDSKPPEAKIAYMQHYQMHKMRMVQQLASQMQAQGQQQGPPKAGGGVEKPGGAPQNQGNAGAQPGSPAAAGSEAA